MALAGAIAGAALVVAAVSSAFARFMEARWAGRAPWRFIAGLSATGLVVMIGIAWVTPRRFLWIVIVGVAFVSILVAIIVGSRESRRVH